MLRKPRAVEWEEMEHEKKRTLPTKVGGGGRPHRRGLSTAAARARAAAVLPPTGAGACKHGTGCHSRVPQRPAPGRVTAGAGEANSAAAWKPPPRRPRQGPRQSASHGGAPRAAAAAGGEYTTGCGRRKTHGRAPRVWHHERVPTGDARYRPEGAARHRPRPSSDRPTRQARARCARAAITIQERSRFQEDS